MVLNLKLLDSGGMQSLLFGRIGFSLHCDLAIFNITGQKNGKFEIDVSLDTFPICSVLLKSVEYDLILSFNRFWPCNNDF